MTDFDLAAIKRRHEAAEGVTADVDIRGPGAEHLAVFFEHARDDVPKLLVEVERQRDQINVEQDLNLAWQEKYDAVRGELVEARDNFAGDLTRLHAKLDEARAEVESLKNEVAAAHVELGRYRGDNQ